MQRIWDNLIRDNPMSGEAERAVRRFLRSGGDNTRGVNLVSLIFMGIFYLWILSVILRSRENVSGPLLFFELTIFNFVIPAAIYNSLSGEFERETWEALILTRLTIAQIVAGKLIWRMVLALIISGLFLLPLIFSLIVGDRGDRVSFEASVQGKLLVLSWAFLLCGFGIWVSAHTKKSVTSISILIGSLLAVLGLVPTVLGLFGLSVGFQSGRFDGATLLFNLINPYLVLGGVFDRSVNGSNIGSPLWLGAMVLYNGLAIFFIYLTYMSLKRRDKASAGIRAT